MPQLRFARWASITVYLRLPIGLAILMFLLPFPLSAEVSLEIQVEGVGGELRDNVLSRLSLQRERDHPLLSEYRLALLHRRADEEIREALRPFGYYQPLIQSELERTDDTWRATYRIQPGNRVRVDEVDIRITGEGDDDPELQAWLDNFPLRQGDVLEDTLYEDARESLLRIAQDRGYLEGELTSREIRVNVREERADISLHFDTGPRYRFGEVHFDEIPLRESFLRRFLPFQPGDPYDAELLFQFQRDLSDSDYFERVDVIPRTAEAEQGTVPVMVELVMRPRTRYTAGVGYGTDTGPRLSAGLERRWANERGHRLGGSFVLSNIGRDFTDYGDTNQEVAAYYRIPLERPTTDFLGLVASWEQEETDITERSTIALAASLTHLLQQWQRTLALNLQREQFEVAGVSDQSSMLFPSIAFQRIEAADRIFPIYGWRLAGELRGASENVLSATDLVQGVARGKVVGPLLGGRLLSRVDVGSSEVSDFDALPVSLRFFAGGDQSVRGFAYRSLGPTNSEGEVTGGKHLLVASIEYDRYISERTGFAVFYDTGNAFNSLGDMNLHRGVGVGARWRFPFGVIRLDIAAGVSEPDTPWRLHLTLGPEL